MGWIKFCESETHIAVLIHDPYFKSNSFLLPLNQSGYVKLTAKNQDAKCHRTLCAF